MRTRFCATMRRPAFSIMALMAPVRLRSVASGLSIEKVRSIAIGSSFTESNRKVYGVSLEKSGRALIPVGLSDGKIGRPEAWVLSQECSMLARYRMFAGCNAWCNERRFQAVAYGASH